jgi:hypothetical protein
LSASGIKLLNKGQLGKSTDTVKRLQEKRHTEECRYRVDTNIRRTVTEKREKGMGEASS